jgi:hypothetical protein
VKVVSALLFSLILVALRVAGVKHQAFQAIAHIWVSGLFCTWYFTRRRLWFWVAVAMSAIELACFIVQHFFPL